ncbi:MAG: efflux RND transporter periplasmic adaptor subunit [Planctomycetes bacterium]|nr:efflux RND transporter periplasmic adaptor subunit [Planctomycetota bacterium]
MTKKKRSGARVVWAFLIVVALGVAGAWQLGWLGGGEELRIEGAPVRRGPLEITVTERGNLEAQNSYSLKNEVEGRTTILYLIEEGTYVRAGDLVAELDASELVDRRVTQEITVQSARASKTKAEENLKIQEIENESQIAKARQQVEFATTDLEKFREGDRPQQIEEVNENILLREAELVQAEATKTWSEELFDKGFIEKTELDRDQLAFSRAEVLLEQSKRSKELLTTYEHPKEEARLAGDLEEAQRQLRKAELQAVAQLADYQAAFDSSEVKLQLEEEKLAKYLQQIDKARLIAPVDGMVVYGREEGSRWGGGEPVTEGGEVRERQEIATIPGAGGMIAKASVHESVLKQVREGLPVIVRIDALPGREFPGVVDKVAVLPDKNSWWANPNLRLYRTDVSIENGSEEMRPGMSCNIEILVDMLEDTLYVPLQAVYSVGGRNVCWVQKGLGYEERTVEVGPHNEVWVAIESGLEEGEIVLLSPPPGAKVGEQQASDAPAGTPRLGRPEGLPANAEGGAGASGGAAPRDGAAGERTHDPGTRGGGESAARAAADAVTRRAAADARRRQRPRRGRRRWTRRRRTPRRRWRPSLRGMSEPSSRRPAAQLESVSRVYRMGDTEVRALDDFSFTFQQGEYWAIMGSSGSGKSTLLNILGCIDRASSGRYRVDGQDIAELDDDDLSDFRSRKLGFIFQSYNLIPQLNVLENILVPLFYQDEPPEDGEERALELARRVGLGERLDHRPQQLSGGQQQRVAIARSLINDPTLILADEATGNLDSATAEEILDLFDELHAEGKTILLVTHEPDVGARAEHVLKLKDGNIEAVYDNRRGADR